MLVLKGASELLKDDTLVPTAVFQALVRLKSKYLSSPAVLLRNAFLNQSR